MIKEIVTEISMLNRISIQYSDHEDNMRVVTDLIDTAMDNRHRCLGLSSNQIGSDYSIFVIKSGGTYKPIINPKILCKMDGLKSDFESCLSLPNMRVKVRRYKKIKISYISEKQEEEITTFVRLEARIVQHELDHLNGILI